MESIRPASKSLSCVLKILPTGDLAPQVKTLDDTLCWRTGTAGCTHIHIGVKWRNKLTVSVDNDDLDRYNTFYVLYPVGIASEMYLIYRAIEPAGEIRIEYTWLLRSILMAYVPGESIALYPPESDCFSLCLHIFLFLFQIVSDDSIIPISHFFSCRISRSSCFFTPEQALPYQAKKQSRIA